MTTAANPAVQDDLNKVIPTVKTIPVAGEEFPIRHFKIGKLPEVLVAIQPIAYILLGRAKSEKLDILNLVIVHTNDSLSLLSVLADRPRDWVNNLDPDEAVLLLSALLEVNLDFFIQKVLPQLLAAMDSLGQTANSSTEALNALGQMASKTSLPTATVTPTS
ncbi:hypothetical protein [Undibacterium sp. TC9W]|uniref:hypothetical protein n=1 Tax=Undibacterium sp. TC9W TaxID=3413053 RepID=UPI003BF3CEE1